MADAHETLWQDVQAKPPKKLLEAKPHRFLSVRVTVVFPGEEHGVLLRIDFKDAFVGYRRPMGVAGEIAQHCFRPGKGALGIDVPCLARAFFQETLEVFLPAKAVIVHLQLSFGEEPFDSAQKLRLVNLRESLYREEITRMGGLPSTLALAKSSCRNDDVQVIMIEQGLAPSVQHRRKAELAAEFVSPELEQSVARRLEQQPVKRALVEAHQRVELVRQGEDQMKVAHRQERLALFFQPLEGLLALASRAMPVAAGVRHLVFAAAFATAETVPAQGGGAAQADRGENSVDVQRPAIAFEGLLSGQSHDPAQARPFRARDVRTAVADGCRGAHGARASRLRLRPGALEQSRSVEQLQRTLRRAHSRLSHMQVARRRAQGAMAEELLHHRDLHTGLQQVGGKGVAQTMNTAAIGQTRPLDVGVKDHLSGSAIAGPVGVPGVGEQPPVIAVAALPPIRSQLIQQPWRENRVTVLSPLAVVDSQKVASALDLTRPQTAGLFNSQPAPVNDHQKRTVPRKTAGLQQPRDLLPPIRVGEPSTLFRTQKRPHHIIDRASYDMPVEKPHRADLDTDRAGRLPTCVKPEHKGPDPLVIELVRTHPVMTGQLGDGAHVVTDGIDTGTPQRKFLDKPLTKRRYVRFWFNHSGGIIPAAFLRRTRSPPKPRFLGNASLEPLREAV
jgi:hypothetical protein